MPLPLMLGVLAGTAALTGAGLGVKGVIDLSNAQKKLKDAQKRDKANLARLERMSKKACETMDRLGSTEMKILSEFEAFSNLFARIKNHPTFANMSMGNVSIPKFEGEKIKQASVGASALVGSLSGAVLGTAAGYAAAGATTSAVMALGTASTGTAISTLVGVAETNAALAALGGGSLAAGGGGMALGTTILGATSLGVGLLIGGVVFSLVGSNISDKADKAAEQMLENEKKINDICNYLFDLDKTAKRYHNTIRQMRPLYFSQLKKMEAIINSKGKYNVNWQGLTKEEQLVIENMILIVSVLFNMCKVQFVSQSADSEINVINKKDIAKAEADANNVLASMGK